MGELRWGRREAQVNGEDQQFAQSRASCDSINSVSISRSNFFNRTSISGGMYSDRNSLIVRRSR